MTIVIDGCEVEFPKSWKLSTLEYVIGSRYLGKIIKLKSIGGGRNG